MPKKTNGYYGNYMRVLQEMLKNPTNTVDPYAGIATNEKC
jgi:RNA binding exosome subunit